jgi:HSP20 family protein
MLFRYEPAFFNEIFSLTEPVERTFPSFFPGLALIDRTKEYPYVNVAEYKDEIQVVAEIPGIPKENVKLQLHDGMLTISGERKAPEAAKDSRSLQQEISYGSFSRTIQLPEHVEAEKVTAEYLNGILRVILPKLEALKPKEIAIR